MKKQLIIIGIIIILLAVGLSGCEENNLSDEEKKFVGTWVDSESYEGRMTVSFIFSSDKTFEMILTYAGGTNRTSGTWIIVDDILGLNITELNMLSAAYKYNFTNNDNTLTIVDDSGNIGVFTKQ